MAGIGGIVYPDLFQAELLLEPLLEAMQHRGAGQEGYSFQNVQIGACGEALARNEKRSVVAVLDGDIYNISALRHELKQHGYHLFTSSAAEVIVSAYDHWGVDFIQRVDGDFAIAIFDEAKRQLILFRDRVGKKPLYWYHSQNYFIFGSELKALLVTGIIPQTPASDAIAAFLCLGYVPQDMTPIDEVNKLLPGHFLQLNIHGSKRIESYWSYSSYFANKITDSPQEIARHLDGLLKESVSKRLLTPSMTCLVSGGLGSASVAHYVSEAAGKEHVNALTANFQGQNDADVHVAKMVAKIAGIDQHLETIIPHTLLEDLIPICWHMDEPFADPTMMATWRLSKWAGIQSKTVFSGMGSDELLAGHSRYRLEDRTPTWQDRAFDLAQPVMQHAMVPLFQLFSKPLAYQTLRNWRTNRWQAEYLRQNALFSAEEMAIAAPSLATLFDPEIFLHKFHNLDRIQSPVASFIYFDVKTRLPDSYMLQYDRLTAAHGLHWQTPFLDRPIIEYLAGMPEPTNPAELDPAACLKTILRKVYPDTIVNRPKKSRPEFLTAWVEQNGLYNIFRHLQHSSVVETGLISEKWLKEQIATPAAAQRSFRQLWAILILEVWFRLYINRPVTLQPPRLSVHELFNI